MTRILVVEPQKCDGCGECIPACQKARGQEPACSASHIKIISIPNEQLWLPLLCQHCEQPPCALMCPTGALLRDQNAGIVRLNNNKCVGCGMCMASCPFGAIQITAEFKKATKCDLCEGAPACVPKCKTGALTFSESRMLGQSRRKRTGSSIGRVIGGWR